MPLTIRAIENVEKQLIITNELLRELISQGKQTVKAVEESPYDNMKRPQLMKEMSKTDQKGWNNWSNEKMIEHLKGVK